MKKWVVLLGLSAMVFAQESDQKFCLDEDLVDTSDVLAIPLDEDSYEQCQEVDELFSDGGSASTKKSEEAE